MSVSFAAVVINTLDPVRHAGFYRQLLGWDVVDEEADWVRLRDPVHERPGLSFQLESRDAPPAWPAQDGDVVIQTHLDLLVDDLEGETARAVSLGAAVEQYQPAAPGVRVMRDPLGHIFCLFVAGA